MRARIHRSTSGVLREAGRSRPVARSRRIRAAVARADRASPGKTFAMRSRQPTRSTVPHLVRRPPQVVGVLDDHREQPHRLMVGTPASPADPRRLPGASRPRRSHRRAGRGPARAHVDALCGREGPQGLQDVGAATLSPTRMPTEPGLEEEHGDRRRRGILSQPARGEHGDEATASSSSRAPRAARTRSTPAARETSSRWRSASSSPGAIRARRSAAASQSASATRRERAAACRAAPIEIASSSPSSAARSRKLRRASASARRPAMTRSRQLG